MSKKKRFYKPLKKVTYYIMKLPKDLLEKEKKKINGNLISHRKSQVKNKSPYKKNKIQDIGKWKSRILSYCMEKDLFKAKNEYYKLIESNPLYTYFLNEDIPLKQKKNFQLLLRKFMKLSKINFYIIQK